MSWWKKDIEVIEEPELSLAEQLVEAKAELAKIELLPEDDFTRYPGPYSRNFQILHGVDEKPKAVARAKADIAYLEAKMKGRCNE